MAEGKKSFDNLSRGSSKKSKTSVTEAVSRLTVKALKEFRLDDDKNATDEDDTVERIGKLFLMCSCLN